MSSLKSSRQIFDKKSTKSAKSRSTRPSMKEVEPKVTKSMKTQSLKSKLPNMNMSQLLKGRPAAKRPVSFEIAKNVLPVGARISYVLWRLYEDRKTGEKKYVYCNSAFYQGNTEIKSFSIHEKKEVITPMMIVVSGSKTYYLSNDDVKELYVYEKQDEFCAKPKERCEKQLRSKSLDHTTHKSRDPKVNRAKSLLHN